MESNWRFGVWAYGLGAVSGHGARSLAARSLSPGTDVQIITDRLNGFGQALTYLLPGNAIAPDAYVEGALNRLRPHFPYGYEVETDH